MPDPRNRSGEHRDRDPGSASTVETPTISDRSAFESLILSSLREIKRNLAELTADFHDRHIKDALLDRDVTRLLDKELKWDEALTENRRLHAHIVAVDARLLKIEETRDTLTNALVVRVIGVATFLATVVAVCAAYVMHKTSGP